MNILLRIFPLFFHIICNFFHFEIFYDYTNIRNVLINRLGILDSARKKIMKLLHHTNSNFWFLKILREQFNIFTFYPQVFFLFLIILLHNNGIKLTLCNPKFSLTSTYIYISNADHTLKPPKYRNIPSIPSFSFFFLHRKDLTLSNTVDVNYQTYFPRWKRGIKRARRVRTSVPLVPFGTVACHFRSPSSPMSSTTTTTKDREIKKMKKKVGKKWLDEELDPLPRPFRFKLLRWSYYTRCLATSRGDAATFAVGARREAS